MNKKHLRLAEYLSHIIEAISRIEKYVQGMDRAGFISSQLVQDAVIRNLENIGEASRNIDKHFSDFVKENEDTPFLYAYEMRNALSHGYFKVDIAIVWETICNDLPDFKKRVEGLLGEIEADAK